MEDKLSADEMNALEEIAKTPAHARPSARVARNAKRLNGLKYVKYVGNNQLALTDKGTQALFMKHCIDGMRAVSEDPAAKLDGKIAAFLARKGHIVAVADNGGWQLTDRGRESLADIDATGGTPRM
jgi:Mn-dependent DtxR family transcriptional regulator